MISIETLSIVEIHACEPHWLAEHPFSALYLASESSLKLFSCKTWSPSRSSIKMERVQVGYFVRVKVIFSEGSASLRKILLDGARKWLISSFQQHSIWSSGLFVYTDPTNCGVCRILHDLLISIVGLSLRWWLEAVRSKVLTICWHSSLTASSSDMKCALWYLDGIARSRRGRSITLPSRIRQCRDWPSWLTVVFT